MTALKNMYYCIEKKTQKDMSKRVTRQFVCATSLFIQDL